MDIRKLTDVINHDNFGRLYSEGVGFRAGFNKYLEEDPLFKDVFPTLKLSTEGGILKIALSEDSRPMTRRKGEDNATYLLRAVKRKREGFSRVRTYSGSLSSSTRTGGYTNKPLQQIAEAYGIDVEVKSYSMKGIESEVDLRKRYGDHGLIVPDSDVTSVIEMSKNGKKLKLQEIMDVLNIDPDKDTSWAKRLKGIINETSIQVSRDLSMPGSRKVSMFMVDEQQFFSSIDGMGDNMAKLSTEVEEARKRLKKSGVGGNFENVDTLANDAYKKMADGSMLASKSYAERMMGEARGDLERLKGELSDLKKIGNSSQSEISEIERSISKLTDLIEQNESSIRKGEMTGITRVYNADGTRVVDGKLEKTTIGHAKGEVRVVEDELFSKFIRGQSGSGLSDKEILDSYDIISPMINQKDGELGRIPLDASGKPIPHYDVRVPLDKGDIRLSVHTIEPAPTPKVPTSNTLTTSSYGNFVGTRSYLPSSLQSELAQHVEDIRKGRISGGLNKLIDDMAAAPVEGDPNEIRRITEAKTFARRFKALVSTGADLTEDPVLTKQLLSQIEQHYFRKQKKGKIFNIGGREVSYEARFPMLGGNSAHLSSAVFEKRNKKDYIPGTLAPQKGSFVIQGMDASITHAAFGGFDLDDSFYGRYVYDSKKKRLLYQTLRDPNAVGEYYLFDADITRDPNMPQEVKKIARQQKKILKEINNTKKEMTPERASELLEKLNNNKDELDKYYSSGAIDGKNGKILIEEMDVEKIYSKKHSMPTPSGTTTNLEGYRRQSAYLSQGRIDASDPLAAVRAIRAESANLLGAPQNPYSPFSFVAKRESGAYYSEYNEMFDYRVSKETLSKPQGEKLTVKAINEQVAKSQAEGGILGRVVNQDSAIDSFITSHVDYMDEVGVDDRVKDRLKYLIDELGIGRIERESLIDAQKKQSDQAIVDFARKILGDVDGQTGNMELLGRLMKDLQDYSDTLVDESGKKLPTMHVGLDPVVAKERLSTKDFDAVARGFGSSDFILSELDPKSTQAQLVQAGLDIAEKFIDQKGELIDEASRKLSEAIGNDFTAKQLTHASNLVQDYEKSMRVLREAERADSSLEGLLGRLDSLEVDGISRSTVHGRMIKAFDGMGTTDILAVYRVLLSSTGDLSMLDEAIEVEGLGDLSLSTIANRAKQDFKVIQGLNSAQSYEELLQDHIEYLPKDNTYRFKNAASGVRDQRSRNQAAANTIERLSKNALTENFDSNFTEGPVSLPWDEMSDRGKKEFLENQAREAAGWERLRDFGRSLDVEEAPSAFELTEEQRAKFGELGAGMREHSDQVSDSVSTSRKASGEYRTLLKRLDLKTSKGIRSGLIAATAFAGFGIAHKIITGDRSVDEMNPYPLIPQGSNYESILNKGGVVASPAMNQGSMSYTVRAYGVSDAADLSGSLQGVLPRGKTTIYDSRALDPGNYNSNSRDILNQRIGQ